MANVESWQGAVMASMIAVELLKQHPLAELVRVGERSQSIGALVDPTLWRDKHRALAQNLVVLRAARDFVATIEAARMEAATPKGGA